MLAAILLAYAEDVQCQATSVYTEANLAFKRGLDFYNKGLYGQAQHEFLRAMQAQEPPLKGDNHLLQDQARLYYARAAVRREQEDGEMLIADFIRDNEPTGVANGAKLEMANYYYNSKKYEEAIRFYDMVNPFDLSAQARTEMLFKKGYALFVRKDNASAKAAFASIKDEPSEYYHPANYYYAMTVFFDGDYASALEHFEKANATKKYNRVVPYYLAQIYFAKGDYDNVIKVGEDALKNNSELRGKSEINQLVGQAYFEKQQYSAALPYLQKYVEEGKSLRPEDLYQTGFAAYRLGKFKDAIKQFEQLDQQDNAMGQSALYSLGDCYLRTGDRVSARNAFAKASRMNFNQEIKEEALFNYAKLSYELKYPRDAVAAIQSLPPSSKYFDEGQILMSNIFLNTRDYDQAMRIIESMPNRTPKMRQAYQEVAYLRGVQLYGQGDYAAAKQYLELSQRNAVDQRTTALAQFWLADLSYQAKNYDESIRGFDNFFKLSQGQSLPDEASDYAAAYTQGYNHLKKQSYATAADNFVKAVKGIKNNLPYLGNDFLKKQVLPDAILRTGDMFFKQNKYKQARTYYDEVIASKYAGFDYALYQKAIIQGLEGQVVDKIIGMEELSEKYPTSPYADDALYSLGSTYLEIGKYELANKALFRIVTQYKDRSDLLNKALLKLGLIAYNQKENDKALNYYKQVFSNNPSAQEAKEALASIEEIYIDMGQPDAYFAFLESLPGYGGTVTDIAKDSINFKAADVQYENGEYEKAIEGYTKYLRNFPNGRSNLKAHFNRAESYLILKDYDRALPDYEFVANKGQSAYYESSLYKAAEIAYNYKKDFKNSYKYYALLANVAAKDDDKLNAQLGALRSAWRLEQPEAVLSTAELVVKNPKASPQQKGFAYFYQAKAALQQKDLAKSLNGFKQTLALVGDSEEGAEARYRIATIYYQKRELAQAKEMCMRTYSEIPNHEYWIAKSSLLLSDIFAEQGDLFNARAVLEGLLESYTADKDIVAEAKAKLAKLDASSSTRLAPTRPADRPELEMDGPLD